MRREEGQSLVEFALVVPMVIGLVTAIAYFGILFFHKISLTDDLRVAARMATVCNGASSNPNYVNPVTAFKSAMANDGFDPTKVSISAFSCPPPGSSFTLVGSYPEQFTFSDSISPR